MEQYFIVMLQVANLVSFYFTPSPPILEHIISFSSVEGHWRHFHNEVQAYFERILFHKDKNLSVQAKQKKYKCNIKNDK